MDYKRGQIGVKVLEGLGDFRKGGDDIPHEGPRQALFTLPPGSRVAVMLDIQAPAEDVSEKTVEKGESDGMALSERGDNNGNTTEIEATDLEPPVQKG